MDCASRGAGESNMTTQKSVDDINKLPILMAIFREHKLSLVEAKKIADTVMRKINEQREEYWERSECT